VTVNLAAPGTRMVDRWNQLDLSVQKTFKVGRVEYQGMFQFFNATNASSILNQNTAFGPGSASRSRLSPVARHGSRCR
jgi:hypothetical protein